MKEQDWEKHCREIVDLEIQRIKEGGCPHEIKVIREVKYGNIREDIEPCLELCNEDDYMLSQYFRTHGEVMDFIDELHKKSIEAFEGDEPHS